MVEHQSRKLGVVGSNPTGGNILSFKKLEKTYTLYTITLQKLKANEILYTTPEVLVDDFDVVDIFRRVSDEDKDSFEELKTRLKGKTRDEVNIELNRYIKERMDDIQTNLSLYQDQTHLGIKVK